MPRFAIAALAGLAACATAPRTERSPIVPLGPQPTVVAIQLDEGPRAAADRSPPAPFVAPPAAPDGEVGASVSWRTVTQTVEVPAPQPATEPEPWSSGRGATGDGYGAGYWYGYHDGYRPRRYRDSTFPINTLIGVGIGSLFDHHHGHRHRGHHHHHGAWIGGGIGLLLDLNRRWW